MHLRPPTPAARRAAFLVPATILMLVVAASNSSSPKNTSVFNERPVRVRAGELPDFTYMPFIVKSRIYPPGDWLLISEIFYDPTGIEPDGEWIELWNPGRTVIDLSQYKVGDAYQRGDREGMLRFPPGSTLAPEQVIVVANRADAFRASYNFDPDFEMVDSLKSVPDMLLYPEWANRGVELTNSGDEVVVLNGADWVVDAVGWGLSLQVFNPPVPRVSEGRSSERYPPYEDTDSASDWRMRPTPQPGQVDFSYPTPVPSNTATPTMTPVPTAFTKKLLISEVLYDPNGAEPDLEWIELYNADVVEISLAGFKVGDEEMQGGIEGMLVFPSSAAIEPQKAIVIANRGDSFEAVYHRWPDFEMVDTHPLVPNLVKYPAWSNGNINLGNDYPYDEVLLLDALDQLVDCVSWGTSIFAFDPPVPAVGQGTSLERYPPGSDTNTALDWRSQAAPQPGQVDTTPPTPTPSPTFTVTPDITVTPTPVTPTPVPVLVINEIHADPSRFYGDANGDGNIHSTQDEFIEIYNAGDTPAAIGGWAISLPESGGHVFDLNTIINPGCAVVVFGGGTPQGDFGDSIVQTASTGHLWLDDGGDVVTLLDLAGRPVVSYTYGVEGADDQSITRSPDISGPDPLVKHLLAPGAGGNRFSPGTRLDGVPFAGCTGSGETANLPNQNAARQEPEDGLGTLVVLALAFLVISPKQSKTCYRRLLVRMRKDRASPNKRSKPGSR